MRLYAKTLLIVIATLVALIVGIYLITQVTMGFGMTQMKQEEAQQNAERALHAIDGELQDLMKTCTDYAVWDDTYRFMESRDEGYVAENLQDSVYNLELNCFVFVNSSNQMWYGSGYDYGEQTIGRVPETLVTYLEDHPYFYATICAEDQMSGVLRTPDGFLLLATRTILKSDGTGPANGVLILGRYLDDGLIASMNERAYIVISQYSSEAGGAAGELLPYVAEFPDTTLRHLVIEGGGEMTTYVPLRDFEGIPVGVLKVTSPRSIIAAGQYQLTEFVISFASIILLIAIGALFLIETTVLSRIKKLESQVRGIGRGEPGETRVEIQGNDEIASLGTSINTMLDRIEEKDREIRSELQHKDDFINVAAHELRSPLQPILGYLTMLTQTPREFGIDGTLYRYLTTCKESAEREQYIVDRMLELSVLSDTPGEIAPFITSFSLPELLQSVIAASRADRDAEISLEVPPDLQMTSDRAYIYMIMETLVSNALRYSKSPRRIRILYEDAGAYHIVSVTDNGVGMPTETLKDLFRPFYIVDVTKLSRMYDRMGLSLAISRKLVRKLKGEMAVSSDVGKGTTFILILPKEPGKSGEQRSSGVRS